MFWDKKEDKKNLPDLPPLRNPPRIEGEGYDRQGLPSFPDNLSEGGFSQAAIKGAVSESDGRANDKRFKAIEMEEWSPESNSEDAHIGDSSASDFSEEIEENHIPEPPKPVEKTPEPSRYVPERVVNVQAKNADVFVKLDKFYSARKTLMDVQGDLEDLNSLLKKIREIKMREEQELTGWEKEMENVKSRLNDINLNLFEKVN